MYAIFYDEIYHGSRGAVAEMSRELENHPLILRIGIARIRDDAAWLRYHAGVTYGAFARPNHGDARTQAKRGFYATQAEIDEAGVQAHNREQELKQLEMEARGLCYAIAHRLKIKKVDKMPSRTGLWLDQTADFICSLFTRSK